MPEHSPEFDPADLLALDEALALRPDATNIVVIGTAEFAAEVLRRTGAAGVRVFDDHVHPDELAPDGVTRLPLSAALFAGAELVVGALPKSLGELDELAATASGVPGIALVLGGRVKFMNPGMNERLARSFSDVSGSLGRQKSRALRATGPLGAEVGWPRRRFEPAVGFDLVAHGGAFAGTKLDLGTRALLDVLPAVVADVPRAGVGLDLGCGTGVLATALSLARMDLDVYATDRSWAAAASASLTAAEAGAAVTVTQEDTAASVADGSVDLVLLNPPFHDGHAVIDDLAEHLFAAAARVLRPGGSLVTVFNSHLRHRPTLQRIVGATTQLSRTPKFTVTRSVR